jgi:hypothetical protein
MNIKLAENIPNKPVLTTRTFGFLGRDDFLYQLTNDQPLK